MSTSLQNFYLFWLVQTLMPNPMKSLKYHLILPLLFFLGTNHRLIGQTDIPGGEIYGNWPISGSPYKISDHATIPKDSTLSIDPGVIIEFQGYYRINVQGQILAKGLQASHIVFTVNDTTGLSDPSNTAGGWNGIRFIDTAVENDSSIFEYCDFQYGKAVANQWHDNSGGAICVINFDKIRISQCTFTKNVAGGIEVPSGGAIHLCWSDIVIEHSLFINNSAHEGGAIQMHESSPTFRYNMVENNQAFHGGGITIGYLSKPVFYGDSFIHNTATELGGGMMCWDSTDVKFEKVMIEDNNARRGAGIGMASAKASLDSSTIKNNHALDLGGGIAADFSEVTIENSSYNSNSASMSGGMHAWYSDLSFADTEFSNNIADVGAGLHGDFSVLELTDCYFLENEAAFNGGGLHIWNSDVTIQNSTFTKNTAISEGGAMEFNLGDTLVFQRPYQLQITESDFQENHADFRTGGLKIEQFDADTSMADIRIEQCNFIGNHAERIAAFRIHGNIKDFEIRNSKINDNTTDLWNGGASFSGGATGQIINCEFANNTATSGNPGATGVSNGAFVHYINCTFYENIGGTVGGLSAHRDGKASITNCIFWNNQPKQVSVRGIREGAFSELYINHCNIQYGLDSVEMDELAELHWGNGNIDADPLFMDPENGDLKIAEDSPCIDAGISQIQISDISLTAPELDILGNSRIQFETFSPDMGAYEYQPITHLKNEMTNEKNEIKIFPNPSNQYLNIVFELSKPAEVSLIIYNLNGQIIRRIDDQSHRFGKLQYSFDGRQLHNGLYICRILINDEIFTKKIVIY
jgi:hypothetical protein